MRSLHETAGDSEQGRRQRNPDLELYLHRRRTDIEGCIAQALLEAKNTMGSETPFTTRSAAYSDGSIMSFAMSHAMSKVLSVRSQLPLGTSSALPLETSSFMD